MFRPDKKVPIGAMAILLGAMVAAAWVVPISPLERVDGPESVSSEAPNGVDVVLPPVTEIDQTAKEWQERPLFAEKRRNPEIPASPVVEAQPEPQPPPAVVVELPTEPPPDLKFMGYLANLSGRSGLFRDEATGLEVWANVGEAISGWTLIELSQTQAQLAKDGKYLSVPMYP